MAKKKILVVDDEENIVELLRMNLESLGYQVDAAYTGMDAIVKTNSFLPDLILLDLMLPDIDGLQVSQMIRLNEKTKDIPIIMVSARSEESNKVEGLSMGADDYVTKPFGILELEARIKTVLRRGNIIQRNEDFTTDSNIIKSRDLVLDIAKYELRRQDILIDITPTEFKILRLLMINKDKVTTREAISKELGLNKDKTESRTIDVHMLNLRNKLREVGGREYIETIRGIGYKLK